MAGKGSADTRTPNLVKRRESLIWRTMGTKHKEHNEPREIQEDLGSTTESKASESAPKQEKPQDAQK